jgi:hypothetical protein
MTNNIGWTVIKVSYHIRIGSALNSLNSYSKFIGMRVLFCCQFLVIW